MVWCAPMVLGILGLDELHLHLTEVHKGVASAPPGRPAAYVHPVELVHVPGHRLRALRTRYPA